MQTCYLYLQLADGREGYYRSQKGDKLKDIKLVGYISGATVFPSKTAAEAKIKYYKDYMSEMVVYAEVVEY